MQESPVTDAALMQWIRHSLINQETQFRFPLAKNFRGSPRLKGGGGEWVSGVNGLGRKRNDAVNYGVGADVDATWQFLLNC